MTRAVLALLAALPLASPAQEAGPSAAPPAPAASAPSSPSPASPAPSRRRSGVFAGLGVGVTTVFTEDSSGGGVVTRLRVGGTVSPRVMLGVEANLSDLDSREQLTSLDAATTFFPTGDSFFVRGGFGLTRYTLSGFDYSERGINLLAGLGFRFGNPDGLSFTVNLEYQYHALAGDTKNPSMPYAWVGLEWH